MTHTCPHCGAAAPPVPVPESAPPGPYTWECLACRRGVTATVLNERPRLSASAGSDAPPQAAPGEAECFAHPGLQATGSCEGCGRHVCGLCGFAVDGDHLCGACLHLRIVESEEGRFESYRILYDAVAMAVAVLPLVLMPPLSLFSGPLAVAMVIRWWKRPLGMFNRSRFRHGVAMLSGLAQMALWILFFLYGNRLL